MCLSTLICCPWAYSIILTQLYPPYFAQILGLWVTCGVKMMWLCHVWGWQPPQTAFHIHIRHIQHVWAHWYAVHIHMVAALHIPTLLGSDFGVLGHWSQTYCLYIMVEADSHLKLLPTFILDIQSVWAHWYAVHRHMVAALHSYTHPTCLRFWGSGSLVESKWCHYVMFETDSHLKLLPTSILDIYKVFGHIDMLSICVW
jgi:hypothetical protein